METVTIKMEESLAKNMKRVMKSNQYTTKTEFIREAIRDKLRNLTKEESLERLNKMFGSSKRKTTDAQLREAGEKAFHELERELQESSSGRKA